MVNKLQLDLHWFKGDPLQFRSFLARVGLWHELGTCEAKSFSSVTYCQYVFAKYGAHDAQRTETENVLFPNSLLREAS